MTRSWRAVGRQWDKKRHRVDVYGGWKSKSVGGSTSTSRLKKYQEHSRWGIVLILLCERERVDRTQDKRVRHANCDKSARRHVTAPTWIERRRKKNGASHSVVFVFWRQEGNTRFLSIECAAGRPTSIAQNIDGIVCCASTGLSPYRPPLESSSNQRDDVDGSCQTTASSSSSCRVQHGARRESNRHVLE